MASEKQTEEEKGHFHESYFEHQCVVGSEKDVLLTDIRGTKWLVGLRRWWHGLFLLWYGDERCRVYYSSSHALRLARARQFRRYRGRIHPLSKFSNIWAVLILIVSIANRIVFHHNTSVMYGRLEPATHIVGVVFEVIMLADLIVNFKSGYVDVESRRIVLSSKKCLVHYCSTKLFLHVVSAIPLQGIMLLRYKLQPCHLCNANKFVCCLKILSTFSLIRVYEVTLYWTRDRSSFNMTYFFKLLRILVLAGVSLLQFLNLSDAVNIWIITETNHILPNSFLYKIMEVKKYMRDDSFDSYFSSVQFSIVCKSIFLFGYGGYAIKDQIYYVDAIQSLTGFIIANLFRIWAFVEWYTVIHRQKTVEDHMVVHKDMTMNFMRSRRVSDQFGSKIVDYYDFIITKAIVIEKLNELYQLLPTCIIKEIKINCYYRYVRRIPYFADWPSEVVEDLVILLKEEVYLQEDVVAPRWSQGEGLMILHVGMLAVYTSEQREVGHLIDGDYFGELSLVTDREVRTSEVVAITPCKILVLYKKSFRRFMRHHAKLFFDLREILRDKFSTEFSKSADNTGTERKSTTFESGPPPQPRPASASTAPRSSRSPPSLIPPTIQTSQDSLKKDQMMSVFRALKNFPKNLQRDQQPGGQSTPDHKSTAQTKQPKDTQTEGTLNNQINDNVSIDYEWPSKPTRGLSELRGSTGIRRPSTQMDWANERTSPSRPESETPSSPRTVEKSMETGQIVADRPNESKTLQELLRRRRVSEVGYRYTPAEPSSGLQSYSRETVRSPTLEDSSRMPPTASLTTLSPRVRRQIRLSNLSNKNQNRRPH